MSNRLRVTLALAWCCLCAVSATGAQIVVSRDGNGDFHSIQSAVDAASYGDSIFVNPGTYTEPVILKSGVSITGAGASNTILSCSYGYQPTLSASSVSAVTITGLGIERSSSILEAAALKATSSQLALVDCVFRGGRPATVIASGATCELRFEDCRLEDAENTGLHGTAGATILMQSSVIRDCIGHGAVFEDAGLRLEHSEIRTIGLSGIAADGTSDLELIDDIITSSGRYGLECHGSVTASLEGVRISVSGFGAISLSDDTAVQTGVGDFSGGNPVVTASGRSTLDLIECTIAAATGDGLHVADDAHATLENCEIVMCSGNGVVAETSGGVSLEYATIAGNGGDGVLVQAGNLSLTHCIVSMNEGTGIRIATSPESMCRASFNNVWGNRLGDYVGMARPRSDSSQSPGFAAPSESNYSLRVDSASLTCGRFGGPVGRWGDPALISSTTAALEIAALDTGATSLAGRIRLSTSPRLPDELSISCSAPLGRASFAGQAFLQRSLQLRGDARFELPLSALIPGFGGGSLVGAAGSYDGEASWWSIWGSLVLDLGRLEAATRFEWEQPTGLTRQDLELSTGSLAVSSRAIDFVPGQFALVWAPHVELGNQQVQWSAKLVILPALQLELAVGTSGGQHRVDAAARIELEALGSLSLSGGWTEAPASVDATLDLEDWTFRDLELHGALDWGWLEIGAMLGVHHSNGPRLGVFVQIDASALTLPPSNQPPSPAFDHTPYEPEAGEPIRFDAAPSFDPDGTLDQRWWDFGDGETAIGANVEHTYAAAGEYTVTLTVSDNDADVSSLSETLVVYAQRTTPIASFVWAPITEGGTRLLRGVRTGDSILLDASASLDSDGTIVEYAWDLQSDGVFDRVSDSPHIQISPLEQGAWPITLRVIDDSGRADAVMRVLQVTEPKPPRAAFEITPRIPAALDPVRFLDRSVSGDADIVSWTWDFGDGHAARDQEPVHRFASPGEYTVSLDVLDAEGHEGATQMAVEVVENPTVVPIDQVWALVIGISDYEEVDDLSYASDDARAIAQWLLDSGVPRDHIRLLTDTQAVLANGLESDAADLVNVREALGWLRQNASRDDLVFIHYSGHGYQGADDNADEADGVDEFFVLHDTRAAAKDDTALRDDEFGHYLDRIASEHVLIFFDSCYSGGLSRSLTPGQRSSADTPDLFSDFALEGRLLLSASEEGGDAFESPQLKHGVFTYFLLQGLRGEADLNGDDRITAWELHEYTRAAVPDFVMAERGERQIPQLIGEGESRILLATAGENIQAECSFTPDLPYAGATTCFANQTSDLPGTLNAVWTFGDGSQAQGDAVQHVYAAAGHYTARLSLQSEGQERASGEIEITVADPATVLSLDTESGHILISVGEQNGIHIGDHFAPAIPSSSESEVSVLLEVVELVEGTKSVCTAEGSVQDLPIGLELRPLDAPSCPSAP